MRGADILGPDRGCQPVYGIVRHCNGLGCGVECEHHGDRAEDLLARDAHVVGNAGEQRWRDVAALLEAGRHGAAALQQGALVPADIDVVEHPVLLLLGHHRSHRRGGIQRIAR